MKRIYILLSLLVAYCSVFGQTPQNLGGPNTIVITRGLLAMDTGFVYRTNYTDTTAANTSNYLENIAGVVIRTGNRLWMRSNDLTQWLEIGSGSLNIESSTSITLSGDGSVADPLTASLAISETEGNLIQVLADGVYVPNFIQNGLIEGGEFIWVSGYTYDVVATTYAIGGIVYHADETQLTLSNSDPTLDRIDRIVATTSETIIIIEGTPADDPQEPSYDPLTQLPLGFIYVTANTIEPDPPPAQEWIYINNTEWTTLSSTARINPASTSNPYSSTLDVEATLAQNGDNIRFTDPSPPTTMSTYDVLTFKLFSKSAWANTSRITFQWYSGATPVGNAVVLSGNSYGFNSSQVVSYQTIAIGLPQFGPLTTVTALLATVTTTGGATIGFYLDDIQLQEAELPILGYNGANGITLFGNEFQLGGTLIKPTTIATNTNSLTLSGANTIGDILTVANAASGANSTAIRGTSSNNGVGVYGGSSSHYGIFGTSATGVPIGATVTGTVPTIVRTAMRLHHSVSAPAPGAGTALEFSISSTAAPGTSTRSNRIISTWTNATTASIASDLIITGFNVGVEADLFTLSGSGAFKLNNYGDNTFTGTATRYLAVDVNGNIIEEPVPSGGATYTADNGLTLASNNVKLGGTLLANTTIAAGSSTLSITTSAATIPFFVTATSGIAISAQATSGVGIQGYAATGIGIQGSSDGATYGGKFQSYSAGSNSTVLPTVLVQAINGGAPSANGFGSSIDYALMTSNFATIRPSNTLVSKWSDATDGTRTSQFIITGINNAVAVNVLTINGNGSVTLGAAYQGLGAGYLAVSDAGEVTWSAGGGGGGGDALTSNPLSQFAATTSLQLLGVISDETGSGSLVFANSPVFTTPNIGTATGSITGNAATATALQTARNINGVSFDGTADITVTAAAGTLTGTTLNATVVTSSLTSVGTIATGTWDATEIGVTKGGTGLTSLGTAGQILRVNAGATGLEYATISGAGTVTSITLTQPAAGFTVTNSGVAATTVGTFTFALANDLLAVENLGTTGIVRRTGTSTWSAGTDVSLTDEVSGILDIANGGTGLSSATSGRVLIGNGTTWTAATPTGSNGITITMGAGTMNVSNVFNPTVQTLTDGSTITWNVTNGGNAIVTLASTGRTLSITNPVAGYTYTVRIIQGSGGGKTITTWPTGTRWQGGTAPTLSSTAGDMDVVSLFYDGSNYYGTYGLDYN